MRSSIAIRIYSRLAYAYWFKRGAVPTLWAHLREMNLAERYGPRRSWLRPTPSTRRS